MKAAANHRVWLVYLLTLANLAIFALEIFFEGRLNLETSLRTATLFKAGAIYRPAILAGDYWRLLTASFVHANAFHLACNLAALLVLGFLLERYTGALLMGIIYALAGLGANILSFGLSLHGKGMSVGASGAVVGLAGALIGFSIYNRVFLVRQTLVLGAVLVANLALAATVPGVDNWAHVGGLISGSWLGLFITRSLSFTVVSLLILEGFILILFVYLR